jgi:hypothetical protein
MKMRVEVPRTAPVLKSMRVKLKRIERRPPKPKVVGSSPITRPMPRLVQRENACPTSKLRGFDSCTRQVRTLYPGIAQLAERATENREVVGSTPTPWTILKRASSFAFRNAWQRQTKRSHMISSRPTCHQVAGQMPMSSVDMWLRGRDGRQIVERTGLTATMPSRPSGCPRPQRLRRSRRHFRNILGLDSNPQKLRSSSSSSTTSRGLRSIRCAELS